MPCLDFAFGDVICSRVMFEAAATCMPGCHGLTMQEIKSTSLCTILTPLTDGAAILRHKLLLHVCAGETAEQVVWTDATAVLRAVVLRLIVRCGATEDVARGGGLGEDFGNAR